MPPLHYQFGLPDSASTGFTEVFTDTQWIEVHFSCLSTGTVSVWKSQAFQHLLWYILQQFVKGKKTLFITFIMSFLKMLGTGLETFFTAFCESQKTFRASWDKIECEIKHHFLKLFALPTTIKQKEDRCLLLHVVHSLLTSNSVFPWFLTFIPEEIIL